MIAGSPGRSWTPWPSTQRLSASKPTGAASSLSVPRPPGFLAVLSPSRASSLDSAVIQSPSIARTGVLKSRGSAVRCLRRVRGVRRYRGRNRPQVRQALGFLIGQFSPRTGFRTGSLGFEKSLRSFPLTAGTREGIEIERRGLLSPHRLPGP